MHKAIGPIVCQTNCQVHPINTVLNISAKDRVNVCMQKKSLLLTRTMLYLKIESRVMLTRCGKMPE